jgi:transketolase
MAEDLNRIAAEIRYRLVQMSNAAKTPHLGSGLSCVDILVAAYWNILQIDPQKADALDRDRFILSKGHAAAALYAVLAKRGFFPADWLDSFGLPGAPLAEQPAPNCAPGVELATGSLGHGLPVATGMALAARLKKQTHRVLAVMSDGECNEGTVWEAAMFAAGQGLGNLTVVVDYNKWQATGRSNEVMMLESLVDKWSAFGWNASEVDGHSIDEITARLKDTATDKPTAVIAHTVKGKGISFMEDDNNWHYRIPKPEEVAAAKAELGLT